MMEYTKKQHFAKKIFSLLIALTLTFSLIPPLRMTAYAAGDITLSVQNDTSVSSGGTGLGYGQELISGEADSDPAFKGIKIYYTDYASGASAGQVGTVSLEAFNGGSGIGMFHAQENNSGSSYWEGNFETGNMVIEKIDGSSFQFKQLDAMFGDNVILVIKGYLENKLVGTVEYVMNSVTNSAVATTLNTNELPTSIFGNVDKVTITGRNYNGNTEYDGRLDTAIVFFAKSVTVGDPILPDITAPVLSAVNVSSIDMNTATLHFNSDEAGTYYYLVCPESEAAPSAVDIIAQGKAAAKGSGAAAASANSVNISGLTDGTAYKVYVVESDASSNVSAVSSAAFVTVAKTVISSAAIALTAPAKGSVPSTAASPESAANYTVSAAAWNGNPAKFLGGTAYSAGFTLTPNEGYKFTADTTVAVTGAAVTTTLNSNGTISVSADFPALEAAALVGIEVKTRPAKTSYTYGESFAPAGLTISKTFDDGTTTDLTYDDSTKSNFAFLPATLTAGTSAIILTCGGETADIPITVAKQAVAAPVIPNSVYTGKTLTADVADSSFYTVTANAGGTDAGSYTVTLTLKDAENYKWSDSESAVKILTYTIEKAAASSAMKTIAASVPAQGKTGAVVTLSLPAGAVCGTPTAIGAFTLTDMSVNGTTLTYDAPASQPSQTGTITIPVTEAKNYYDYDIKVTVTSVAKTAVTITGLTAVNGTYSGSAVTGFTGTPAGYSGNLIYTYYLADSATKTTAANSGAAFSGAAPVNAGSYQVIVSVPESDENYTGSTSEPFAIFPAVVTVGAGTYRVSKVYDGTANAGAAGGVLAVSGILAADSGTRVVPGTIPAYSAAAVSGAYTLTLPVSLIGSGSANYTLLNAAVSVPGEITKANPAYTAPMPQNVPYNYTRQPLITAGTASNGTLWYSLNGTDWDTAIPTAMDAGSYTVYYRVVGDTNYNDIAPQSVTARITKRAGRVLVGLNGWIYGEPANTPDVVITDGDYSASTYEYKMAAADDSAYSAAPPTEAGSYTLRVSCAATAAYDAAFATASFVIEPKTVTPSLTGSAVKIYDGSAVSGLTVALPGVLYGDAVTAVAASCTYNSRDAGAASLITASGITLSGAKAGDYILSTDTATLAGSIAPKAVAVSGITARNKVYDGTTAAILVTSGARFEGLVAGDTLGVTAVGAFADQNAGMGKTVFLSGLALTGSSAGNYQLASYDQQMSAIADITPAVLTVTAADKSKTYGEADPALSCEVSGWKGTDSVSLLTGALSRAAGEAAGNYNITAGTLSAGSNYTIQYIGASLTIGKAGVALNVFVSPAAAKPGKTVTITVRAVNSAAGALVYGASQPAGVTLQAPDGSGIVLTKLSQGAAGTYTGSYTIPRNVLAGSALTFIADVADDTGNYTNPSTKDAVLTVTAMSAVNLTLTADKTTGVTYGDSVTYTAQAEKANPAVDRLNTLDGTVTFWLGDPATGKKLAVRTIGTEALTVTLDAARLTKGTHTITAVYSGNAEFGAARQSLATSVAARTLCWDTSGLSSTKLFDGTLDAPIIGELKLSDLVDSDDPGFTYDKAATSAVYADSNPGTGKTATVTVADAVLTNPNYILPAEKPTFAGTITAVPELAVPIEAEPHGYQLKLEMETGISGVPDAITASDASLSSPEAVKARLRLRIEDALGTGSAAVKDFDLTLWISQNNGVTWEKAMADNFPAGGITVVIPWSDLGLSYEQARHYNFAVTHMFAAAVNGHTPGTIENPDWTVTPAGLRFKLNGLSPVAVGSKQLPLITFEANGGSNVTASAYTSLSGKLASLPVPTRGGYSFRGWYTQINGGDEINTDTVFTSDMTIYARWNANESSAAVSASGATADTGVTSPRTGDNSRITFWGGLMLAGLFCLAATIRPRRRGKQKNAC